MSTRSTTHFKHGDHISSIVYRHWDGYPSGAGTDLYRFFADIETATADTRFSDASYLAAKYVVWLSKKFAEKNDYDFLGVGVVLQDPGDIEYRYEIDCGHAGTYLEPKRPAVKCFDISADKYVEIPVGSVES